MNRFQVEPGPDRPNHHSSVLRDIPLKWLLILAFLVAGLLPVMVWTIASYEIGRNRLKEQAFHQLESVRDIKRAQIDRFFADRMEDVRTVASDPSFIAAFNELHDAAVAPDGSRPAMNGQNGGRFQADAAYREVHDRHIQFLAGFIDKQRFYDMLFLDEAGYVFFSVAKEDDFGRFHSADTSALGDAWRLTRNGDGPVLTDMKLYAPSANAPAQFVAAPILTAKGARGAIVLQISIESIDSVMGNRSGMGQTGETYLVGADRRLRSDSVLAPGTHSVVASFNGSVAENGVDTTAVAAALSGKTGRAVLNGYRGARVLSAFSPLKVGPATWAVVAEVDEDEIDRDIDRALSSSFVLMLAISTASVILIAMLMGALISRHVRVTGEVFGRLTEDVLAGDLAIQGDPAAVGPDFRPLMKGTNALVRAFASRIDDIPVPVVMVDVERVVRYANTSAASLCRMDRDSMIGAPCCAMCRCDLADGNGQDQFGDAGDSDCRDPDAVTGNGAPESCSCGCPAAAAMAGSKVFTCETFLQTGGDGIPVRITSSPVSHPDGHVIGAWQVMIDLSVPRRMELEKRRLENQLYRSQRLESLGTMASGIAHDFNNILSYMLVYADLAATDVEPDSPARRNLDEISKAIERAADIVRQMLAFSRQMDGRRVVFAAAPVVADTVRLVAAGMPADIRVEFRCDGADPMIEGDPTHLSQIVMNLCSNSRDAFDGRGGTITIELSELPGQSPGRTGARPSMRLNVSDNGCGMDAQTVERIFEPFFTTKAPGKGTGLGMSVVHGIVTTWGGEIHVDSAPGRGTSIEILLPLA